MNATRTAQVIGPFFVRPKHGACTACGRSMTAGVFLDLHGAAIALNCNGCKRQGVKCNCPPVEGYTGLNGR